MHQISVGTYCQYAVLQHENVHHLHQKLTFDQGAALGVPYLTAYRALFHKYVKVKYIPSSVHLW